MKSLDHVHIDSENTLYLIFDNVDGYTEENNGNKYLVFASTDKNKEVLEKYTELWNEAKNQNETINGGKPIKYKKDFMKIRFELDDVALGKILGLPSMIIVTRFVFQKDSKLYPQVYLHECWYEFVNELQKVCNACAIYMILLVIFFMITINIYFQWYSRKIILILILKH